VFGVRWIGPALGLAAILLIIDGGCGHDSRYYTTNARFQAGMVVSLDGVGGYNWGPRWLRAGLDQANVKAAIVIYDWSKGPKGLFVADLVDEPHNREAARDLAQMVATYVVAMSNRPVTLIGHSGGAAIVVWALEAMPENCRVERAILLAPALAPDYNLARALRAVRSRLYVMYSPADLPLMGAGTAVFGTMDRQHSLGAGLVGFRWPADAGAETRAEYAKVREIRWTMNLITAENYGGHMGWTTTRFAREFIAPILTGQSDPGEALSPQATRPGETPLPAGEMPPAAGKPE
jgi:pimeloyl-ACP methyl ester carboxylesterase